jgi:phenylpyruvate tautomerase PptA (4-oxalocrotonate tautomerase family)
MPNVDIISLPLAPKQKQQLTDKMTQIFVEELSPTPAAVTIRFHDVPGDSYAVGGKLQDAFVKHTFTLDKPKADAIFELDIAWYAGKTPEQQDKVAARLTEAVRTIPGAEDEIVEIHFSELSRKNSYENGRRISVNP